MKKIYFCNFPILKTAISIFIFVFFGAESSSLNAQMWPGATSKSTAAPLCGTNRTVNTMDPGGYVQFNTVNTARYYFNNCATANWDSDLSIWRTDNATQIIYTDGGPGDGDCSGFPTCQTGFCNYQVKDFEWVSNYTGQIRVIQSVYQNQGPPGYGWNSNISSATLQYRQITNFTHNTSTANLCNNSTRSLSVTGEGTGGTFTVQSGGGSITGGNTYNPGTYSGSVNIRYTLGACFEDRSFTVQAPPTAPTSITSSAGNTICNGQSTTLSFSGGTNGSGANIQWFAGSCGSTVIGTGTTLTVSPSSNTTYFVRRVGNTSCTNATACASLAIAVQQPPTAPTGILGTTEICIGQGTTLAIQGGTNGDGADIQWFTGSCGGTLVGSGTSISVTPSSNTTYFVRRVGNTNCTNTTACVSATVNVQQNPTPPTSISLSENNYCSNSAPGTLTLDASGGSCGSGCQVRWFTGSCNGTSIGVGNPLVLSGGDVPTTTTTYWVLYDDNCGVTTCAQRTVTVLQPPTTAPTTVSVIPTVNCENSLPATIQLIASGGSPGTGGNANWYSGSCGGVFVANGSSPTVLNPGVTTTYYVRYENGCGTTSCVDVTYEVDELPTASAGGSATICENGTATVSGASASNGTIQWTHNGSGDITAGATTLTPTYTANADDAGNTVTLTMTVTSNNTCGSATATYTVNVDPLPEASAGGSQSICPEDDAIISGASASNGTILWTHNGNGDITAGATTLTPTYSSDMTDAGSTVTLTMKVRSNNACGSATATATYTVDVQGGSSNVILVNSETQNAILECVDGDWTYYARTSTPDEFIFAIRKNGNAFDAEITILHSPGNPQFVSTMPGVRGTWLIPRTWNVDITGTISSDVCIRFFVDMAEIEDARAAATAYTPLPNSEVTPLTFFKHPTDPFTPSGMLINGDFNFAPQYLADYGGVNPSAEAIASSNTGVINGIAYYELCGISSFSGGGAGFSVSDGNPALLPVELLDFSANAKETHIQLDWRTATEINNDGFEVQRSEDGENFETIAWVEGNGNTTNVQTYQYEDYEAKVGMNYYRLKQIDFDGEFEYTYIVSGKLGSVEGITISNLRPNPANERVFIDIETDEASLSVITVYNHMGQKAAVINTNLEIGKNTVEIETAHLSSGAYFVSIESNAIVATKKFVIAK